MRLPERQTPTFDSHAVNGPYHLINGGNAVRKASRTTVGIFGMSWIDSTTTATGNDATARQVAQADIFRFPQPSATSIITRPQIATGLKEVSSHTNITIDRQLGVSSLRILFFDSAYKASSMIMGLYRAVHTMLPPLILSLHELIRTPDNNFTPSFV